MLKKRVGLHLCSYCFLFMKQYAYLCTKMIIYYNIKRVVGGERNKELFKKLENSEIWEFRTLYKYNKTAYRLFAFWDKDKETLVIATHGIIKKTQKTPSKEIAKAEAIRKEYFKNK